MLMLDLRSGEVHAIATMAMIPVMSAMKTLRHALMILRFCTDLLAPGSTLNPHIDRLPRDLANVPHRTVEIQST